MFHKKKTRHKAGLPPGSLVHTGKGKPESKVTITVLDYSKDNVTEEQVEVSDLEKYKNSQTTTWINVDGVHDLELVKKIGDIFGLHPLVQEDIMDTDQRSKLEEYDDYLYFVMRMFQLDNQGNVFSEQVSIVLSKGCVISFQESGQDVLDSLRDRIRNSKGRVRGMKSDYLAYAIMDSIVDYYFVILEHMGEQVEELEEELISDPDTTSLQKIHGLKRDILYLRKSVWPLRELLSNLQRGGFAVIGKDVQVYIRDLYDHTIQVIDTVETLRDVIAGQLDIYLSSLSNKMNEVMQVLTIIATIFIPLTFIAGVYGMNFHNMPELAWQHGYFYTLAFMALIGVGLLFYFRKKDWL